MIVNSKENINRKSDAKFLAWVLVGFVLAVWLCTPPGNKFMQICFWGNHTQHFIAKIMNKGEDTEYIFHRNNAVYLARMEMPKQALIEMNKAIQSFPAYISDTELEKLYKDSATLKMFYGDYKGALNDYLKVKNLDFTDKFKLAMLLKTAGKNKLALDYCNSMFANDPNGYAGYICIAEVYAEVGRPDASVNVLNLLIQKSPNRAQYYADRAHYKRLLGEMAGADQDLAKAKELNPHLRLNSSIVKDTLEPKVLPLSII